MCALGQTRRSAPTIKLQWDVGARLVELVLFTLRPFVKLGYVHHDLSLRIQLDVSAIHRPRGWPFEVNRLAVVTAAMARTPKLILARFPVRRAPEMGAAGVDHKNPVGRLVDPNAILLLPLGVNAERVIRRKAHRKFAGRLKNRSRQEKPEKHQKVGQEKYDDA